MSAASIRGGKSGAPRARRSSFPVAATTGGVRLGSTPRGLRACLAALGLLLSVVSAAPAQVAADVAVQVTATVQKSPPAIALHWPANAAATAFTVYRKAPGAAAWGSAIASLPGSATGHTDSAVAVGVPYEYWVSSNAGASGYVLSGIEIPLVESRGKVVLVVDASMAPALASELARLESDLAGDGWVVIRRDVSRSETVANVKALIQTEYARDPTNVRAVFLFGHVPVPYAGATAPDGHSNHYGAWPADLFYGDMDGVWTDDQNYRDTRNSRACSRSSSSRPRARRSASTISSTTTRTGPTAGTTGSPPTRLPRRRQSRGAAFCARSERAGRWRATPSRCRCSGP
jgi:hypothetical protein